MLPKAFLFVAYQELGDLCIEKCRYGYPFLHEFDSYFVVLRPVETDLAKDEWLFCRVCFHMVFTYLLGDRYDTT